MPNKSEAGKIEEGVFCDEEESIGVVGEPNLVDFDGPDDPKNPLNWTLTRKYLTIIIISFMTLSSMITLTLPSTTASAIMAYFHSSNDVLSSFITSVYLLGYAVGPLFIAPMSELYGRRILYQICIVLFLVFNVACALSNNLGALLIFRFLAGNFGSCPLTIGASTIADMIPPDKRGLAMSVWTVGPLLGPALGPIAGGYVTRAYSWRWCFWLSCVFIASCALPMFIFLKESNPYTVLKQKTKKLQKETNNPDLRSILDKGKTAKQLLAFSIKRPFKMIFLSPIVFLMSAYAATTYGYFCLIFIVLPKIFADQYRFSSETAGIVYLGFGIGSLLGLIVAVLTNDRSVAFLKKRHGGVGKPEYRLPALAIDAFLEPAGLFWFAWSAYHKVHWIVPILGTGMLGLGSVMSYVSRTTYLTDAYENQSASAIAASSVLRYVVGAFLPLAAHKMYAVLGVGWATSVLGFVAMVFIPLPFVLYKCGERIRKAEGSFGEGF